MVTAMLALSMTGCGGDGAKTPHQTQVDIQQPDANQGLMASGRAEAPLIDPQQKVVAVVSPPSAPHLISKQQERLSAERKKVEGRVHALMDDYSESMGSATQQAKYQQQIGQELQTYKQQTLQLYKLRKQTALAEEHAVR